MENKRYSDVFIIGGGINGCGIAANIAFSGLSVTLCEKSDLASGTSSASTKLIHGGLRYLEQCEFTMVREALQEREILFKKAPHLIYPMKFILPYEKFLRPAWLIRIGLFLYDHLANSSSFPKSQLLNFKNHSVANPLTSQFKKGFSYYDCMTDDARLVIENAIKAHENKASILTRTELISARYESNLWKIQTQNNFTGEMSDHYAKVLINAGGPFVSEINNKIENNQTRFEIKLVKGSHIVTSKLYEGDHAYVLQNTDKRIIFVIPYEKEFTLIGTTDIIVNDVNSSYVISEIEKEYLCGIYNHYFNKKISIKDIRWSYSGVRCLQNDKSKNPSKITRDYKILISENSNISPLVTILGGKLTAYRRLAEDVSIHVRKFFPEFLPKITQSNALPGGNIPNHNMKRFCLTLKKNFDWLPENILNRYAETYGTRVYLILKNSFSLKDLGEYFGYGLYEKEIRYLIMHEWARTVEDILWRRTKIGLSVNMEDQEDFFGRLNLFLYKILNSDNTLK